jgi:hypothetical protein
MEVEFSTLPKMGCQFQTCGGVPFSGLLDRQGITGHKRRTERAGASQASQAARLPHCERFKIMMRTMRITLSLTMMTGLGAIKLRTLAMQSGSAKSFLSELSGGSSMERRAAPFGFIPPRETSYAPFHHTGAQARSPLGWQMHQLLPLTGPSR